MILLDATQHCILTDLSAGGARIQTGKPVRRGSDAVLMWANGLEGFGTIIWAGEHACGILFDEPLADTTLQATRRINEVERLPMEHDMVRHSVQKFVHDGTRF